MLMWPLTAMWHCHMAQVQLFFGQELGNISNYAPSGIPTEHTTSSLSVKMMTNYGHYTFAVGENLTSRCNYTLP
ncbi:hypothetical protein MTR_5g080340 [Medicago truncatula]|uniref:Plastocyanin-like domain-containing protein n=1 Tax=Medicago truncatula TaxID=3880 RepID=G7KGS2_MEDTR|nr:hypothetical protein MTR_5g080340 [Medicago truncatula]